MPMTSPISSTSCGKEEMAFLPTSSYSSHVPTWAYSNLNTLSCHKVYYPAM